MQRPPTDHSYFPFPLTPDPNPNPISLTLTQVTAASGGINSAVMSIVVGEFEKGMTNDFQARPR